MTKLAEYFRDRLFKNDVHPYRIFEGQIGNLLTPDCTILDIGCGRTAPTASKFAGERRKVFGIDIVDLQRDAVAGNIHLIRADASMIPMPPASVDVAYSRSVFEHLENPTRTIQELSRVLKPGARLVVLTPNKWDYASVVARLVPNRYHGRVVNVVEGRAPEDVFPTKYLFNTKKDIHKITGENGFQVERFDYMSQYPNYFMFNGFLFLLFSLYHKVLARCAALQALRGWILVTLRRV